MARRGIAAASWAEEPDGEKTDSELEAGESLVAVFVRAQEPAGSTDVVSEHEQELPICGWLRVHANERWYAIRE